MFIHHPAQPKTRIISEDTQCRKIELPVHLLALMEPQRLTESELIGNPASFQVFRTSLKEPYPLHWHEFYELTFIISGAGSHTVNGEAHALAPGVLFLLTPVDFHQLAPAPGQIVEIFNIIFSGDFLDDELRQWLFGDQCYRHIQLPGPAADRVLDEYRQIWDEHQNPQLGQRRLIRGAPGAHPAGVGTPVLGRICPAHSWHHPSGHPDRPAAPGT